MHTTLLAGLSLLMTAAAPAEVSRIDVRYAKEATESPDFRQHVVPLMGKLGCNGRACHGSFQGQGGFRLSLFGYDFKSDHENLLAGDEPRTNLANAAESLILTKPTLKIDHEGGERLKVDTWQYRVMLKWIQDGAKPLAADAADFVKLEVTPAEMVAKQKGDTWQLKAVAVWSDGTREDVTPLCRWQSNNDQVATISDSGLVTAMGPGDSHVVAFYDNGVVPVPVIHPVSDKIGPKYPTTPTPTKIDELVVQKLQKLGIVQADVCTDAEFLRRVSLDMIGTLPTPTEVETFLSDTSADKRSKKVNELLDRPEYAAWWATKMADWTGNNERYQQQGAVNRTQHALDWYEWLRARFEQNMPYDQIVEGIVLAKSRMDDESYADFCERMSSYYRKDSEVTFKDQPYLPHYWSRSNFRQIDDRALGFAYTFLGVRIQCAQCHKHPFDQWTKDDFDRFKGFFGRVNYGTAPGAKDIEQKMLADLGVDPKKVNGNQLAKEIADELNAGKVAPFKELYVPDPTKPKNDKKQKPDKGKKMQVVSGRTAKVLGGEEYTIDQMDDPRTALMDWMRDDNNPYFAHAMVNRVWAGYFHRGIVEPTDDLSLANPPCNAELFDYLAQGFREQGYDLKWLHREIANSRTYQLSWHSNETNRLDERNFSRAVPRRLPAEVAFDAVVQATSSDPQLEKLHGNPKGRAIADPIVSTNNNGGGRGTASYALSVFGRSIRESNCDCDRSMETSLLQTVFLQNDQQVLSELTDRGGWVDQVVKSAAGVPDDVGDKLKQAERLVDRAEEGLKKAKAAKNEKRIEQMQATLAKAKAGAAELSKLEETPAPMDHEQLATVVKQAYLRTVSRPPTEAELGRSLSYFQETGDLAIGTRDLLWALLNTKEFIVNH
ncbi:DUF1549 domain-containing protein [bacterium]|nr:DUF1549 domain-containing protein [bacterium]